MCGTRLEYTPGDCAWIAAASLETTGIGQPEGDYRELDEPYWED